MAGDCPGDPGGHSRPCRRRRLGGDAALELARAADHWVGVDHVLAGVGSSGAVPDSVRRPFVRVSSPAPYTGRARAIPARDADTVRVREGGGRRATIAACQGANTRCRARAARNFQTELHRRDRRAHAERSADVCAHGRCAAQSTVTRSKRHASARREHVDVPRPTRCTSSPADHQPGPRPRSPVRLTGRDANLGLEGDAVRPAQNLNTKPTEPRVKSRSPGPFSTSMPSMSSASKVRK